MKQTVRKIGSWFWSWGFLKVVLWTVTFIVLFYAEEDWRGARAWAATKAKWEARGETFDLQKLSPTPIQDSENLGVIPLFQLKKDPSSPFGRPLALEKALRLDLPNQPLPSTALSPQTGMPNVEAIRLAVNVEFRTAFPKEQLPASELAQFNALYPFIDNLLAASAARPLCRFPPDYSISPPSTRSLELMAQIRMSKVLNVHAILALDDHQPGVALEDIETNCRVLSGVQREPMLIAGLVAIAMSSINQVALAEGLDEHVWNDAQLTDIENELASVDFLTGYQADLRGEACFSIAAFDQLKVRRPATYASELTARNQGDISKRKVLADMFPDLWADGWIDWVKVQAADFVLNAVQFVDPKARMVFSNRVDEFAAEIAQRQYGWKHGLWHILMSEAPGSIVEAVQQFAGAQAYVQRFAVAQATVDEARIACALERYRLAHGAYPASLAAAASYFTGPMPHDIMNGQPYHYRLLPNGTFMIYSVGWNQKDDGGQVVYRTDAPRFIDYEQGDWVWAVLKTEQP